jgi:hypothetical protein
MSEPILNQIHITPSYTFSNGSDSGNNFKARPINHWRKQLNTNIKSERRMSVGMPMDLPGGTVVLMNDKIDCDTCNGSNNLINTLNKNISCKKCNSQNVSDINKDNTIYNTNSSYLQSRCKGYDQHNSTIKNKEIKYFDESGHAINNSNNNDGTQNRNNINCAINKKSCRKTIYKPSNTQYAEQGSVSSSSRIQRLKYNTLNNNGASFNSASGALGINTGKYQTEPSPSYHNNLKPQSIIFNHRRGSKNNCSPTLSSSSYNMCMYEN